MQKCFYVVGKYVVQVYILNKTNKVCIKPTSLLHVNITEIARLVTYGFVSLTWLNIHTVVQMFLLFSDMEL